MSGASAGKMGMAGGDSMAGAGTSEGFFIHILVSKCPTARDRLGSTRALFTLLEPPTALHLGLQREHPRSPGGNIWTPRIPGGLAEAEWSLRPSLRGHLVSFLAYSTGEGGQKPMQVQGKGGVSKIQSLLLDHSRRFCRQHVSTVSAVGRDFYVAERVHSPSRTLPVEQTLGG